MRYAVTAKHCKLSDKVLLHIKKCVLRFSVFLAEFRSDLSFLEILENKRKKD